MKADVKTIEEFKKTYEQEFGEELSDAEAFERFCRVVNALRILTSPLPFPHVDTRDERGKLANDKA